MKELEIAFEYFTSPVWIHDGEIYQSTPLEDIGLHPDTQAELAFLDDCYQSSYNDDYPPEALPMTGISMEEFRSRTISLIHVLKIELEGKYMVKFHGSSVGLPRME